MSGQLVRLFLVDGNPNGIRTVELSNMTIHTTIFPRTKLKEFIKRDEASRPGCYILLGDEGKFGEAEVYVGEGEEVKERLKQHASGTNEKEFWNEAIVFTSKDGYITKTQIQYLEAKIYELLKGSGRLKLNNTKKPRISELSEVDTAEMEQFLSTIKLLLSSIGIDILETNKREDTSDEVSREIFQFFTKGVKGFMEINDSEYVVLKGSTAVVKNRNSASESIIRMRNRLIDNEVLSLTDDKTMYIFNENYAFNSPSYAAAAISGGDENGRHMWKLNGKNLKELEAEEMN